MDASKNSSLELQHEESKQACQDVLVGKLTIEMATLRLSNLCPNRDAMLAMFDSAIVRHAMNTGTLVLHDLHKFHPLIDRSNLCGIGHSDFATYKRKNVL